MDVRMSGGPSTIAEDTGCDMAGEEVGVERQTEGFPFHGRLVLCETTKGIIPCWVWLWGEPRGPPKAIRGSRETGALPMLRLLLVESSVIDGKIAGWVDETTRVGMEKLHAGCLMKGR